MLAVDTAFSHGPATIGRGPPSSGCTVVMLPEKAMPVGFGPLQRPGIGFGFGFSVIPSRQAPGTRPRRIGEYGWGGAAEHSLLDLTSRRPCGHHSLSKRCRTPLSWKSALKGPIYDAMKETLGMLPATPHVL